MGEDEWVALWAQERNSNEQRWKEKNQGTESQEWMKNTQEEGVQPGMAWTWSRLQAGGDMVALRSGRHLSPLHHLRGCAVPADGAGRAGPVLSFCVSFSVCLPLLHPAHMLFHPSYFCGSWFYPSLHPFPLPPHLEDGFCAQLKRSRTLWSIPTVSSTCLLSGGKL